MSEADERDVLPKRAATDANAFEQAPQVRTSSSGGIAERDGTAGTAKPSEAFTCRRRIRRLWQEALNHRTTPQCEPRGGRRDDE